MLFLTAYASILTEKGIRPDDRYTLCYLGSG